MAKKETQSDSWGTVENVITIMGTWSWVLVLVAAILDIVFGLAYLGVFSFGLWWAYSYYYGIGTGVWYIIAGVIELVLLFIYVLKTFVPKSKAKDWTFLLSDGIFSPKFPKMLLFGILLMIFSPAIDYFGGALVLVPAILSMIFAPKSK